MCIVYVTVYLGAFFFFFFHFWPWDSLIEILERNFNFFLGMELKFRGSCSEEWREGGSGE